MRKLSIIIPIYNEENTLRELIRRVLALSIPGFEIEIIAVDDASTDSTPQILKKYENQIRIYRNEKNHGKGTTVRYGLMKATGDFLVIQDADLEYDPKEIVALATLAIDNKTIVYGSRNLHSTKRRGFLVQRYGTWFTTKLVNVLYNASLTDVWTCYKVFPKEAKYLYAAGRFESDIIFLIRTLRLGYHLIEHPISHNPRKVEEGKKIRYRDGIIAIVEILKDRLIHLRKEGAEETKVKNARSLVSDPIEHRPLKQMGDFLVAENGNRYSIDSSGRPYFMPEDSISKFNEEHQSGINWLKSFFKQFPFLYYAIWHFFCPVLMLVNGPRRIRKYVRTGDIILDVGSGPERLGKEFVNVDIFPFPEVDIVADATSLPFKSGSIPGIVCESVLEHVENPSAVADELIRILKPNGCLYVSAPFIHPYHASPDDFNRWTKSGLKHLFKGLKVVEQGVRSGPVSALLMFLAYWLGIILSFGRTKLAPFITHFLMVFIGPLKFFDFLFYWIPGTDAVATHLYIIARKD